LFSNAAFRDDKNGAAWAFVTSPAFYRIGQDIGVTVLEVFVRQHGYGIVLPGEEIALSSKLSAYGLAHVELKIPHELGELTFGIPQQKMKVIAQKNKTEKLDAVAILLKRLGEPGAGEFDYARLGQKEEAFLQASIGYKVDIVLRKMNSHTRSPIRTERIISACIIDIGRLAEKFPKFVFLE
jgi:hypothetical protein